VGVRPNLLGGGLAALKIARTDEDGEVLRGQLLCDLEADPLIGPGDQGDGFILHSHLFCCLVVSHHS
jgi:hypothetical protein